MTNYEHCKDIFNIIRTNSSVYRWCGGRMVRVDDRVSGKEFSTYKQMQGSSEDRLKTRQELADLFRGEE